MNKYSIAIANEKAAVYKLITGIMIFINLLVFGFVFFNTTAITQKKISLLGLFLNGIAITLFFLYNYSKTKYLKNYRVETALIISALLWLFIGKYLLSVLLICFSIMGFYTNKKLTIQFSENGILYPSFPAKLFLWVRVEQVMLKDDILTIDMKNNKLLQFAIDKKNTVAIDEAEFNKFCREQLQTS